MKRRKATKAKLAALSAAVQHVTGKKPEGTLGGGWLAVEVDMGAVPGGQAKLVYWFWGKGIRADVVVYGSGNAQTLLVRTPLIPVTSWAKKSTRSVVSRLFNQVEKSL
jgi:hypothetical protein